MMHTHTYIYMNCNIKIKEGKSECENQCKLNAVAESSIACNEKQKKKEILSLEDDD